ncbi:hypothetical protein [Streptomyces sp. NPDC058466]|uniref:hypothetical protein n=1 Tax=Streptomyces sp. NPDC058466 TaxID=3346512 RepID=UPI00366335B1
MDRRSWNHVFTIRWDDLAGEHHVSGTSRDIHQLAPVVHRRGEAEEVWNVAVLNETGSDVTARFFAYLDNAAS